MTDINRVLAKMCIHYGGRYGESFRDLMYLVLWSMPRWGDWNRTELVELADHDYEVAVRQHRNVMRFMGGTPAD
ncbi:hypothetical protein [Rhodococcoides yunnanense]|uniref:Uncharacterized protein n=1 Tax=Rhodococcoides yunnanense TaxID=278209 RepID=A0ABU4BEB0_9NOCA|nr:hypothetical protein [Rhodococcus yunnanensis]MDV6262547.1 hypothetical protein [Rhodococcus yunnanensis]